MKHNERARVAPLLDFVFKMNFGSGGLRPPACGRPTAAQRRRLRWRPAAPPCSGSLRRHPPCGAALRCRPAAPPCGGGLRRRFQRGPLKTFPRCGRMRPPLRSALSTITLPSSKRTRENAAVLGALPPLVYRVLPQLVHRLRENSNDRCCVSSLTLLSMT